MLNHVINLKLAEEKGFIDEFDNYAQCSIGQSSCKNCPAYTTCKFLFTKYNKNFNKSFDKLIRTNKYFTTSLDDLRLSHPEYFL